MTTNLIIAVRMVVGVVWRLPWCGVLVPSVLTGLRDLLDGREAGESMGSPGETHR